MIAGESMLRVTTRVQYGLVGKQNSYLTTTNKLQKICK